MRAKIRQEKFHNPIILLYILFIRTIQKKIKGSRNKIKKILLGDFMSGNLVCKFKEHNLFSFFYFNIRNESFFEILLIEYLMFL